MLSAKPRVRIVGHGNRLRVRTIGDWDDDPSAALREACRASTALDKALAGAITQARSTGMTWTEIGRTLGVAEDVTDKSELLDRWAESRRLVLQHQLRDLTD